MPLDKELACRVQALLSEKLMIQAASHDTDLLESGTLDSLVAVRLLVQLEEHFGLKVEMEELKIDDLRSVHSITRLITRRKAAGAAV